MNESWFAVTPIDGETFAISEPLHWEEPHSYLLCGESRALLIDTGLGVEDIGGCGAQPDLASGAGRCDPRPLGSHRRPWLL